MAETSAGATRGLCLGASMAWERPANPRFVGRELLVFETLDSTSAYALDHGCEGAVILAEAQSAGRGRHGCDWHSAAGLGLWFSVVLDASLAPDLVFASALAVRDAVVGRVRLDVKWPNDLTCAGSKVCGILVEVRGARAAVGIGLNVHHRAADFPDDLRTTAVSLDMLTGTTWDRPSLLRSVLEALDYYVALLQSGGQETVWRAWADACGLVGRRVSFGAATGTVMEIDRTGALLIETGGETRRVTSGGVSLLETGMEHERCCL